MIQSTEMHTPKGTSSDRVVANHTKPVGTPIARPEQHQSLLQPVEFEGFDYEEEEESEVPNAAKSSVAEEDERTLEELQVESVGLYEELEFLKGVQTKYAKMDSRTVQQDINFDETNEELKNIKALIESNQDEINNLKSNSSGSSKRRKRGAKAAEERNQEENESNNPICTCVNYVPRSYTGTITTHTRCM